MLEVRVQKTYDKFSLDVAFSMEDEILVLQGESGSGKTTTLDCIAGIVRPDGGRITLREAVLFDATGRYMRPADRNIGYVFQSYALFPHMTIRENLAFSRPKRDAAAFDARMQAEAHTLGITHLFEKYPADISGGEKQRVAFLRAILAKPRLLLMDEPFSALDEALKETLYAQLLAFRAKTRIPVLLVTHQRAEALHLGDRILHFSCGRIVREECIHTRSTA